MTPENKRQSDDSEGPTGGGHPKGCGLLSGMKCPGSGHVGSSLLQGERPPSKLPAWWGSGPGPSEVWAMQQVHALKELKRGGHPKGT